MFPPFSHLAKITRRRLFLRGIVRLPWIVGMGVACAIVSVAPRPGLSKALEASPLLVLGTRTFPGLTHAERALLEFAEIGDVDRGQFAVAGTSADPDDSSNDPQQVEKWSHERDIRASLVAWLCHAPTATPFVNRAEIKILGARIVGGLDLSYIRVPFALTMRKCSIAERITLVGTEIPHLDLNGSYISEIDAKGLIVHGDLDLANGFHASGETRIETARIDGAVICSGGSFHYSKVSMSHYAGTDKPALILDEAIVGSEVDLDFGFRSEGAVLMRQASVAHDLDMWGAHMSNPRNRALIGTSAVSAPYGSVIRVIRDGEFSRLTAGWISQPPRLRLVSSPATHDSRVHLAILTAFSRLG